jgi:hypothetical protein
MKIVDRGFKGLTTAQQTSQKSLSSSGGHSVLEEGPCALEKWFQLLEQANIKGKSPQLHSTTLVLEIAFPNQQSIMLQQNNIFLSWK